MLVQTILDDLTKCSSGNGKKSRLTAKGKLSKRVCSSIASRVYSDTDKPKRDPHLERSSRLPASTARAASGGSPIPLRGPCDSSSRVYFDHWPSLTLGAVYTN